MDPKGYQTLTLRELLDEIESYLEEYPEEAEAEVRVQDEDGIYESDVVGFELANGPWVIVRTQDREPCDCPRPWWRRWFR